MSDQWQVAIAGVSTVVFFGLAGLLVYLAVPDEEGEATRVEVNCSNENAYGLLAFGGVVVGLLGPWLLIAHVLRMRHDRSGAVLGWILCGLAIVACSAAAGYLSYAATSSVFCDD